MVGENPPGASGEGAGHDEFPEGARHATGEVAEDEAYAGQAYAGEPYGTDERYGYSGHYGEEGDEEGLLYGGADEPNGGAGRYQDDAYEEGEYGGQQYEVGAPGGGLGDAGLYEEGLYQEGLHQEGLEEAGLYDDGLAGAGAYGEGLDESGLEDEGLVDDGLVDDGLEDDGLVDDGLEDDGLDEDGLDEDALGGVGGQDRGGRGRPPGAGSPAARPYGVGRRRRRRRRIFTGLAVALVVVVVGGLLAFEHVSHEINPTTPPGRLVSLDVPKGASTTAIADLLAKDGVIRGPKVFVLYMKLEGGGPLLPGNYRLATNESYSSVIAQLEKGPVPLTRQLVVPEGFTIREIGAALGRLRGIGITAGAFVHAATSGEVRSPFEPAGTNSLEGLLFPATYPVTQGESVDYLLQYMVDTFNAQAAQLGLAAAAAKLHRSVYQVVTVASIIEREAKLERDRGPIASVIYNRLARGIPVGAESTLLYGLGGVKAAANIDERNPYNTLVNRGLPPTPIANPGIPSLRAAMAPPHTDYLYWVEVNRDGKMGFASDAAQFAQLQRECRAAGLC